MFENRFGLRSIDKRAALPSVVQRLNAKAVTRPVEGFRRSVPDHEGKHAAQQLNALYALLFKQV